MSAISSVEHNWAHNVTNGPKSRQAIVQAYVSQGNVYFNPETRVIYSYGSHFPMARIVTNAEGEEAVAFTRRTYSVSTAKHLSYARSAVHHMTVFAVPNVETDGEQDWPAAFRAYIEEAATSFGKARRARKNAEWLCREARNTLRKAQDLSDFFSLGLTAPKNEDDPALAKIIADIEQDAKEQRAQERERIKRQKEQDRLHNQAHFERYLSGESSWCPDIFRGDPRAIARTEELAAEEREKTRALFNQFLSGESDHCPNPWINDSRAQERMAKILFEREREQRAKDQGTFDAWLRGENVRVPYSFSQDERGSAYLRTSGDSVETSQRASVPLAHAIKAYRFVKLCRMSGRTYKTNGHSVRVGPFTLDSIDEHGSVNVGCHFFTWERLNEWAVRQGIADAPASDEALAETVKQ